ncbi:MAG TPA: VWA domain-containing protein [Terracidiphilus sp.]|jgi:VWFA-related protein|nr:VWA domain-containing protein [Terracidiphilus sp.]
MQGFKTKVLIVGLGFGLLSSAAVSAQQQQPSVPVPDAPAPQATAPLTNVTTGPITPGLGAGTESGAPGSGPGSSSADQPIPTAPPQQPVPHEQIQTTPPAMPSAQELGTILRLNVTYVEVPVTVKDSKGNLVPGLTWRDFRVFENGTYMPLKEFFVDPFPLSIAFVIDQGVTTDVMERVNNSMGSIQGALTPYDEIAIFTYNHIAHEWTGFTGAQSARVPAVLAIAKAAGEEELIPYNSGPLGGGCNIHINGNCGDPTLQDGGSTGSVSGVVTIPKEVHTLNDAILEAAKELSTRPKGRRRIIYVISDGKEAGSKASYKEVLGYLQTNNIAVWGTLVGDSARWGEGYLSRFHLPFQLYDNLLSKYIFATGGEADSERSQNGIEKSYAKIAEEARAQYTLVYATHESVYDGKFRPIEVRVERPGVEVTSKHGYYPSASDLR